MSRYFLAWSAWSPQSHGLVGDEASELVLNPLVGIGLNNLEFLIALCEQMVGPCLHEVEPM
jgi:hypothetical protein